MTFFLFFPANYVKTVLYVSDLIEKYEHINITFTHLRIKETKNKMTEFKWISHQNVATGKHLHFTSLFCNTFPI